MILGARAFVPFILQRPLSKAWRQRPSRSPATRKKADFVTALSWAQGAATAGRMQKSLSLTLAVPSFRLTTLPHPLKQSKSCAPLLRLATNRHGSIVAWSHRERGTGLGTRTASWLFRLPGGKQPLRHRAVPARRAVAEQPSKALA